MAILERAALRRQADRDPAQWGVSAEIIALPSGRDVSMTFGDNTRVLAAKRSDPFDLLHQAGGLTNEQHQAARRLFRDWCLRAGVRDRENLNLEKIDGGRADPSSMVTDAMVDAGRRLSIALKGGQVLGSLVSGVGPVHARLLEGLISPMVDEGRIIAWRGVVERVTGEKDRNAQGAMVRQACEGLRLVYEEIDALTQRRRKPAANGSAA